MDFLKGRKHDKQTRTCQLDQSSLALIECGSIDRIHIQKIIRCKTTNHQQVNHRGTDLDMQLDGPGAAIG
jgi:ribonuclease PH